MKILRILLLLSFVMMSVPSDVVAFDPSPRDNFGGPREGEKAPNAILKTLDGKTVELADYIGNKPLVLEFGSYTCPIFREKHRSMEELYAKYNEEVTFLLIYTIEAHPKGDACPYTGKEWVTDINEFKGILYRQPKTEAERLDLAQKAHSDLDINIPIFLDDMNNNAWQAYGKAPNAVYLIGTDGRIKLRQGWFKPGKFEDLLEQELLSEKILTN